MCYLLFRVVPNTDLAGYPAAGYLAKNKFYFSVKKYNLSLFIYLYFPVFQFYISSCNFLYFLDKKNSCHAHNIYKFVYTATGYPAKETGYPA